MLAYRAISGAVAMILGAVILAQMLSFATRDGTKVLVGVALGIAMIAFGAHRVVLVWRARSTP